MHTALDYSTDYSFRRQPCVVGWAMICILAICIFHLKPAAGHAENLPSDGSLRKLFIIRQGTLPDTGSIVRIGIFKLESGYPLQVRFDHLFRTGDQFRLEVTSTQRGWLYVMHRQQGDDPYDL
jgi:hypothetical protein